MSLATTMPHSAAGAAARRTPWAQTASGGRWYYLEPAPGDVQWRDVAISLARVPRFGGHLAEDVPHYSVAQHCCLVSDRLPLDLRLAGLLHDAHEFVLGDRAAPLKQVLRVLGGADVWETLERVTDEAIYGAAGITPPGTDTMARIGVEDLRALATERRDLLAECEAPWEPLPKPWPITIQPWPPLRAADEYLARLRRLLPADAPVQA
jgi:hypothetical protein